MNYLNLGCGTRFHSDWTNVDFISASHTVITYDLTKGIPFPSNSFEVVYHSHLLEHFPKSYANQFIMECFRVLRPLGTVRIVVPDLEQIAQIYLKTLENAKKGSTEWADNYEWILLEMYDQTVRNCSGGEMATYLKKQHLTNENFIIKRLGIEAERLIKIKNVDKQQEKPVLSGSIGYLSHHVYRLIRHSKYRKEVLLKIILGDEYNTLQLGRFRRSGEIHQWMYDDFSLSNLLKQNGFENIIRQTAVESSIPNWADFNLDTEPDGQVYKPDSLYMEAIKPA